MFIILGAKREFGEILFYISGNKDGFEDWQTKEEIMDCENITEEEFAELINEYFFG